MMGKRAECVPEIVKRLVREFQPLQILLFGSMARGEDGPDSDLDLLVVMPDGTPKRPTRVAIMLALADLPIAKDIVVTSPDEISRFGDAVGTILRPALREGKVVYEQGE